MIGRFIILCSVLLLTTRCAERSVRLHVICQKEGYVLIDQIFELDTFSPAELTSIAPVNYPNDCTTELF